MDNIVSTFAQDPERFLGQQVTYWVTIDPKGAEALLKHNSSNRILRRHNVQSLTQQMKSGDWVDGVADIAFATDGNMVNGQHTLNAVISAEATIMARLTFGLDPAARVVYDTGRRRNAGEAAYMAGVSPSNETVVRSFRAASVATPLDHVIQGRATVLSGGARTQVQNSSYVQWLADEGTRNWVEDVATNGKRISRMYRGGAGTRLTPVAATYCWALLGEIDRARRDEFFDALIGGSRRGAGDPLTALDNYLDRPTTETTRFWPLVAAVVKAWNAWVKEEALSRINTSQVAPGAKFPKPERPERARRNGSALKVSITKAKTTAA